MSNLGRPDLNLRCDCTAGAGKFDMRRTAAPGPPCLPVDGGRVLPADACIRGKLALLKS
jgi:hypothetical protein